MIGGCFVLNFLSRRRLWRQPIVNMHSVFLLKLHGNSYSKSNLFFFFEKLFLDRLWYYLLNQINHSFNSEKWMLKLGASSWWTGDGHGTCHEHCFLPEWCFIFVHLQANKEWVLRKLHCGDKLHACFCFCTDFQASFHKRRVHSDVTSYYYSQPEDFFGGKKNY